MLPTYRSPRRALIAPRPAPPLARTVKLLPPHGLTLEEAQALPVVECPPALVAVLASIAKRLAEELTPEECDRLAAETPPPQTSWNQN